MKAATPVGLVLTSLLGGCSPEAPPRSEADVQVAVLRQQVGYWLDDNGRESGLLVCLKALRPARAFAGWTGRFWAARPTGR